MFKRYQEVSAEEGFDEVVQQDNTEELKKVISLTSEGLKFLKTFEAFKNK
jgi:predicted transcriptional regulator